MSAVLPNFDPSQIVFEALRTEFLIRTLIKDIRTTMPVEVVAVHPGSGSPPSIGTVDVQPLVQTVDQSGKLWSMVPNGGAVYGVPFSRIQSGSTAIVVDPSVGDIGLASVCDRDISSVIASGGQLSGPGSSRTHDYSDMVYLFSILSAQQITQYIQANASGITVLSPQAITLQSPQINLVGAVTQTNGNVSFQTQLTVPTVDATTDVIVPKGSVNNHVHTLTQPGTGESGVMTG